MIDLLRTWVISFIAFTVFFVFSLVLMAVSFISMPLLFPLAKVAARIVLFLLGVRLKVQGKFPPGGQYIVMANHSGFIDILLIPAVMRGKYTAVVAKYNYRYPVWAQLLKRFKVIPINRSDRQQAIDGIRKAEHIIKTRKYHVIILPEGGRTETGKMKPLKKGGFHMAINTGVPILPIGMEGAYDYKPMDRKTFKPGKVIVRIGEPIPVERYDSLGLEGLLRETEKRLKILSGEVREED